MAHTDGGGSSGGGSGGAAEMAMDYLAVHNAEIAIASAAGDLDAVGAHAPSGDYGEAGAVVATIMATFTEVAAHLVTEGKVLPLGMRIATGEMAKTDAAQAIDFVTLHHGGYVE